jgi:polyribonucleotide nucleotidyltransferase
MTSSPPSGTNGSTPILSTSSDSKTLEYEVSLRGPRSAVDDLAKKIVSHIEAEKQDELERGHVITFDFPSNLANYLIGRKGENINKYREEFDVEIQVHDGKVEIKGPEMKSELAKSKILALRKKLENEVTYVLKINSQYHRDMIGAKGNQVNRLQDRYNVRVQFPRTAHVGNDDKLVVDGGSDVGGLRSPRSNQAPDEVIIRGPKKGADEAKDELLSLLQWTIDNSHALTVSVAQSQLPSLIGQGGRELETLRLATGAQIDVPGHREVSSPSGRVQIRVKGTKKQVEEAKKQLEQRAKVFDSSITKTIKVDKKYHKTLIGSGGNFLPLPNCVRARN